MFCSGYRIVWIALACSCCSHFWIAWRTICMYLCLCVLQSTRMSSSRLSFKRLQNKKGQADFTQGSFGWWNILPGPWCSLPLLWIAIACCLCVCLCNCFLNVGLKLCQMSKTMVNVYQWSCSLLLNMCAGQNHTYVLQPENLELFPGSESCSRTVRPGDINPTGWSRWPTAASPGHTSKCSSHSLWWPFKFKKGLTINSLLFCWGCLMKCLNSEEVILSH